MTFIFNHTTRPHGVIDAVKATFSRLLLICILPSSTIIAQEADIILIHGKIFTSDTNHLYVQALAIQGDKIMATGTDEEILKLAGDRTPTIDLKGKTVVPGFNDAHAHIGATYPAYRFELSANPLAQTPWKTIRDSLSRIVKRIQPGTFIITPIHPDLLENKAAWRKALDSIAPKNPVMLSAWTGHGKILNSAALRFFGYDEHTVIVGGELNKDDHGKLNGVVHEYAGFGIGAYFASKLDRDKIIDDLNLYYSQTVALGITSVQNMCSQNYPKQAIDIYSTHRFPCRVRLIAFPFSNEHGLKLREWNDSYHPLNDMNYVSGVKIILDGTPIERRACMTKPYNDKRGEYGYLNFNEEQLKQFMQYALERQQQILIHAVGDSSIHTVIHCMRSLHPDVFWKDKRLRIEHGEFAVESREDIQTLKQLGIVIVQNPVHFAVPAEMNARFDKEQAKWMQAIHTYVNNNIPLAIGGDGPFDPFLNIMFAVMHPDNPSEALTVEQAVIAYTYGSAYAEFKENEKGRLEKGMLADLAVLSQDIFSIPPDKLPGTKSVLTMIGGKIVYKE